MGDTEGFGEFAVILQKAAVELGNAIHCLRRHQVQEEMRRAARAMITLEYECDELLAALLMGLGTQLGGWRVVGRGGRLIR